MDQKDIGLRIKHLRQTKGLTQKQLADKIGTTWEMVSRYETGKSSSLNRISLIADALGTPVYKFLQASLIEETGPPYNRNVVPLINKPFTDIHKALESTMSYYTVPDWISQKFLNPFAIDAELLVFKTTQLEKNGILFAIQEKLGTERSIIIAISPGGQLIATPKGTLKSKHKPVATIIAWEKRFL